MTRNELNKLFPNASLAFYSANSGPSPVMECPSGLEPLAESQAQKKDSGKFFIRVTSRRRRLLDEDNLCEKYHVDCCRYARLIPSDAPQCAHIEVRQEKIGKGEREEIVIDIYGEANQS